MCNCAGNVQLHLQRLSLAELDDDSPAFLSALLASSDFAPTVADDTA
jgi:hypothetical protein